MAGWNFYKYLAMVLERQLGLFIPWLLVRFFACFLEQTFKRLKADYPRIVRYVHQSRKMFKPRLRIKTRSGNTIANFRLHPNQSSISPGLYTRAGQLIPFDDNGRPCEAEAFHLSELAAITLVNEIDLDFDIFGLRFRTRTILIQGEYHRRNLESRLELRLTDIPQTFMSDCMRVYWPHFPNKVK